MINPYKCLDWQSVSKIGSATHMHIANQKELDNGYKYGIRHFPISNYYPSAPYVLSFVSNKEDIQQAGPTQAHFNRCFFKKYFVVFHVPVSYNLGDKCWIIPAFSFCQQLAEGKGRTRSDPSPSL